MDNAIHDKKKLLAYLDMRHAASRNVIAGIFRFAAVSHRWEVQIVGAHPSNRPLEQFTRWHPDALIIDSHSQTIPAATLGRIAGRATVFVNTQPPKGWRRTHAIITTDERALAEAAAMHLQKKGLKNFAFVGSPQDEHWSVARMRLFRAALKDMGFALNVFKDVARPDWNDHEKALAEWLLALPKPCGVWVAFDHRAKQVIDACNSAGLAVPEQVQVLGTDNETYICEQTQPSLSSLMPDFESGGFAAAQFVDDVLCGRCVRMKARKRLLFRLKGVIERLSTADVNGTARHVALAREFIRKHAISGIDVPSVAAALGVSIRLLQRDFRAVTGHTVVEELQHEKLEHVKNLLRNTTTPIDLIGPMCDFQSPAHLKTLFKANFGMTMSAYRSSHN